MAGISFREVTKRFGDVVAVDDLTLDIEDRELLVLLGPSGCGKSTALRMIAGLDEPTSGTVSIGEEVVNGVDPGDRDIAMVFQSYALYPHMTVFKNIEAPLLSRHVSVDGGTPRRLDAAERRSRVVETAATLDLGDYLDRKPAALSGGQRQRVALARAIVRRPRVFLMDEPLSNLDAKLRTQTRLELVELWRRLETTFVYVTHDQVEAMTMASRIAILVEGRLQQVGRPREVYQRPANLFVARFIGSPPMNTLDATVGQVGEGYVARVGDVALPLRLTCRCRPTSESSLGSGPSTSASTRTARSTRSCAMWKCWVTNSTSSARWPTSCSSSGRPATCRSWRWGPRCGSGRTRDSSTSSKPRAEDVWHEAP